MATGDVKWFAQGLADVMNKLHNLASDDIRIGLVTNATVPSITTAAPHWGGTGTTNFATNQVSTAGTSYTGPVALTTKSVGILSGVDEFKADKIGPLAQDASGPTNVAYGILYNNTDVNKRAIAWVEIAASGFSLATGPLEIRWNSVNGNGRVLSLTQS